MILSSWESSHLGNEQMVGRVPRIFIIFCGLVSIIILAEAIWFYRILTEEHTPEKAEVVVVFNGSTKRVEAGYKLANSGYAPFLVISPARKEKLKIYNRKYALPPVVKHIIEDKARTTFENALYIRRIIEEHHFDSVILVTSFYHLPRSYLLLRAVLIGSNVKVQTLGVSIGELDGENWLNSAKGRKMIYNEMVKSWASIVELLSYKVNGGLSKKNSKHSSVIKYMASFFLLDVKS